MSLSITPLTDHADFLRLPADMRTEVDRWMRELAGVAKPIQGSLAAVAGRMGVSPQTARRKYDAWRKGQDWRALVDRRAVPVERGLAPELVEHWKALCQQNARKCKPAHRVLVRQFFAGEPIPGLPPGLPRNELPRGLSYANLISHRPTDFELRASRIGRMAAADCRPKIFTTRVGMEVGQRYVFDDMWHDFAVVVLGQRTPSRLLQLHAHDLFSGCQFARGMKPRIKDEDTGRSVGLTEAEMLFLVSHVLAAHGYHPRGTVLMVEHGTAAISDDLEQRISDLTGGLVSVDRSGMQGASAFAGQYAGRGKGNFRFKASLESLGNLIHNETADMIAFPGQTGSNSRINAPEELHGRTRKLDLLERALVALPASIREEFRRPFLEARKAMALVEEIMERINRRTDHALEGWVEAGLTEVDYEIPGVGLITGSKVMLLDAARRAAIEAVAVPVARRLSPREVYDVGARQLRRLRPEQMASLLSLRQARTVKVRNHLIELEDAAISPSPLRYLAHHFRDGDEFGVVINPYGPQEAHLFDARGGWVGTVKAWQTVSQLDTDGLHRQMGAAARVESELLTPLAKRGAALTRERMADAQHNASLVGRERTEAENDARVANEALSGF